MNKQDQAENLYQLEINSLLSNNHQKRGNNGKERNKGMGLLRPVNDAVNCILATNQDRGIEWPEF